jgi:IS605 OrfB family transposase
LYNTKRDWHFKLARWIVTRYRNIVVDEFSDHIIKKDEKYTTKLRKTFNHSMYNKSMFSFMQILRHMAMKYGTNYYLPDFDTTNTCAICGNLNINKLKLDETGRDDIFICEKCYNKQDRDKNAAMNCYNAYFTKALIIPEELVEWVN